MKANVDPIPTTFSSAQQNNEGDARHMGCKKAKEKRIHNEMLSNEMEQVKKALKSLKGVVSMAKENRVVQVRNDDEVLIRDITSISDPIGLETRRRLQEREGSLSKKKSHKNMMLANFSMKRDISIDLN